MKQEGTVYRSRLDWSSWLLFAIVIACCFLPVLADDDFVMPVIISLCMVLFLVIVYLGTYYRISGNKLIVYTLFFKQSYPIEKIASIEPTKSVLSAPALSIIHRIAIRFTDRKVLKSTMPLVLSPVRLEEFISQLTSINPQIQVSERL